jgi:ribosomal protein L24E
MDDECTYCHDKFEDGQSVMAYEYDNGELYFCGSFCAGSWFAVNECISLTFNKDEELV